MFLQWGSPFIATPLAGGMKKRLVNESLLLKKKKLLNCFCNSKLIAN